MGNNYSKLHVPLVLAFLLRIYYSKILVQIHSHTHTNTQESHSGTAYSREKTETTSESFRRLMVKYIHTMEYYTTFLKQ